MSNIFNRILSKFKKKEIVNDYDDVEYDSEQIKKGIEAMRQYVKALESLEESNYENSLECFENAVKNGMVYNADLYKYKGNCLQLLNRHISAITELNKSIELNSQDYDAYNLRANSFERIKDYDRQILDLKSALRILSQKHDKSDDEADIFSSLEYELKKAEIEKNFAEKRNSIHENFKKSISEIVENNPETSDKKFAEDLLKDENNIICKECIKKGIEFDKAGKYEYALEYYDYALSISNKNSDVLGLRGYCLQSLGYYLDAIDDFTKAIAKTPNDSNLYFGRGNCYFTLKEYSAAFEDGQRAIYYSSKFNHLYPGYDKAAKESGFSSATDLYKSHTMIWEMSNQSDPEKHFEELYQKALKASDTKTIEILKEREQKEMLVISKLMTRRNSDYPTPTSP